MGCSVGRLDRGTIELCQWIKSESWYYLRILLLAGALIALSLLVSCSPEVTEPSYAVGKDGHPPVVQQGGPYPDGETAFRAECAPCHASLDGFDIAKFSYFDSTIVRRAVAHVDTATANQIVTYTNSFQVSQVPEDYRPFQFGGIKLSSDIEFAVNLFGQDQWPSSLTDAQLLAIVPRNVPVAVLMPPNSTEQSDATGGTVEWVPPAPIPDAVLNFNGNRLRNAIDTYELSLSQADLITAVDILVEEAENPSNPAAPCKTNNPATIQACYNIHLWGANLSANHKLRTQEFGFVSCSIYQQWWIAGDFARLNGGVGPILHHTQKWRAFMYMGWAFCPSEVPAIYTTGGLGNLKRHATFVGLRSAVARAPGLWVNEDVTSIVDVRSAFQAVIIPWADNVGLFGLNHLVSRMNAPTCDGDVPLPANKPAQLTVFNQAMTSILNKATNDAQLNLLANQIRACL